MYYKNINDNQNQYPGHLNYEAMKNAPNENFLYEDDYDDGDDGNVYNTTVDNPEKTTFEKFKDWIKTPLGIFTSIAVLGILAFIIYISFFKTKSDGYKFIYY
jgi:hypothetical protein